MKMRETSRGGAIFSDCFNYRYVLWRIWLPIYSLWKENDGAISKGFACFIGLNPSTADEKKDDPTVRRCINYAMSWGYEGLFMLNLFALRETSPNLMMIRENPIGQGNDDFIQEYTRKSAIVIAAWGVHGNYLDRGKAIKKMIPNLQCLSITKSGNPGHPLYLPKNLLPMRYL